MSTSTVEKFNTRAERLRKADFASFRDVLSGFWRFFEDEPILGDIKARLIAEHPGINEKAIQILRSSAQITAASEDEGIAIAYAVLRNLPQEIGDFRGALQTSISPASTYRNSDGYKQPEIDENYLKDFKGKYLVKFLDYVQEQLENHGEKEEAQSEVRRILLRYKHRSEWFYRSKLWEIYMEAPENKNRQTEKKLALDLYAFLYNQGIDFYIEPSSIRGAIDLISMQNPDDPLLAEAKIFGAEGRGKPYICKGFNQIYNYTQHYNQSVGYLIIFKVTETDLNFSVSTDSRNIPFVIHNHKTIFLITIDIYNHQKPVSQRSPINSVEITKEDLIRSAGSGYE